MTRLAHIIPSAIAEASANAQQVQRQTAAYGARPPLAARESWSGAGLTRTLTLQVINQRLEECRGRFLVAVVLGADGGTVTCTTAVTSGVQLDEFTEAQGGTFITGADGALELDITQTGSWSAITPRVTSIAPFNGDEVADWQPNAAAGGGSGAPVGAQYVTLATNGDLTSERVLTAGTGISVTDGGAGGNVTVACTLSAAPTDAQYVTLSTNGTLTGERVLTAGTGIEITDAGAGSTVTVGLSTELVESLTAFIGEFT